MADPGGPRFKYQNATSIDRALTGAAAREAGVRDVAPRAGVPPVRNGNSGNSVAPGVRIGAWIELPPGLGRGTP